jgi:LysM repeat protein
VPVRSQRLAASTYRRRRLAVVGATVGVVLAVGVVAQVVTGAVGASAVAGSSPSVAAAPAQAGSVYVVAPGDTLWSIARHLQPSGDVRPLVDQLSRRAGGASLQAGQRLDLDGLET